VRCEQCGSFQVSVKDSRAAGSTRIVAGKEKRQTPVCVEKRWGKNFIYRKRQCSACNHKWNTIEVSITKKGYRTRSAKW
jgi:transcriptional regulator NrdR family protein